MKACLKEGIFRHSECGEKFRCAEDLEKHKKICQQPYARSDHIFETFSTKEHNKPSEIQNESAVYYEFHKGDKERPDILGKWMVFKDHDELDKTWEEIRTAIERRGLGGCLSARCSTRRYNPTNQGPGPCKSGVISVHTTADNMDAVGYELIHIVKQDIRYKTHEASLNYQFRHAGSSSEAVTTKSLFWNNGHPSSTKRKNMRRHARAYKEDIWQLNVVTSTKSFRSTKATGYWILTLEYKELTDLWHFLKDIVESEEKNFGILRMECPPKRERNSRTEKPVFHVFTKSEDKEPVGNKLIELVKRDIKYHDSGTEEDLFWSDYRSKLQKEFDEKKAQHLEAYKKAIKEKITILIRFVRINYIGLPRSGKTSFLRRIMGNILNILEAQQKGEKEQPSTGILEKGGLISIRRSSTTAGAVLSSDNWSLLESLEDEANYIIRLVKKIMENPERHLPLAESNTPPLMKKTDCTSLDKTDAKLPVHHEDADSDVDLPITRDEKSDSADLHKAKLSLDVSQKSDIPFPQATAKKGDVHSIFEDALECDWDEFKCELEDAILLNNTDTGGHMEFLDLQTALVHGPSLNLLFHRLIDELDEEFKISYTNEKGESTEDQDSTMTVEQVMFQTLSSITCSSNSSSKVDEGPQRDPSECGGKAGLVPQLSGVPTGGLRGNEGRDDASGVGSQGDSQERPDNPMLTGVSGGCSRSGFVPPRGIDVHPTHYKSKAMLVGTHRDKVSEEDFQKKNKLLEQKIKSTDFYEEDFIEFASENHLMLATDNMTGSKEEIDQIRKTLVTTIKNSFEKIPIPASWLALSVYIRSLKVPAMSLKDCELHASKLGIDQGELQHALWFLHHCSGSLLYYPELTALKGTVICNIQVVFDSTTNLIKNTFAFDKVGKRLCEEFREKAQFSLSDLRKAASKHTDDFISLEMLIQLLEHLHVICTINTTATLEPTYFMPCVLKNARADELSVPVDTKSDSAPLMIRYNCGYTPLGLFPAMMASLISQQMKIIWEGLRKNRVQFHIGRDYDIVTLLCYPRFIEIVISRNGESQDLISIEHVCADLLKIVKSTLENVTSHMNSTFNKGYSFGFECPTHPGKEHLCVLSNEQAKNMECLQNPKRIKVVNMKAQHKVWFSGSPDMTSIVKQEDVPYLTKHLCLYKSKWRDIGTALGFLYDELENITHSTAAPLRGAAELLEELLNKWSHWPTESHHDAPTLERLCDALRSNLVGLGDVANRLSAKKGCLPSQQDR